MKKIPLPKGEFALVDDEDYEFLMQWKWHFHSGYAARWTSTKGKIKIRAVFMHREVAKTPAGKMTDHINLEKLDNRKSNLRICTHSQNQLNRLAKKSNPSGYKGIYWNKRNEKWHAQASADGKQVHIGYFDDFVEAAKKYDEFSRKHHGEFAKPNFGGQK